MMPLAIGFGAGAHGVSVPPPHRALARDQNLPRRQAGLMRVAILTFGEEQDMRQSAGQCCRPGDDLREGFERRGSVLKIRQLPPMAGCAGVLIKPCRPDKMIAEIRRLLGPEWPHAESAATSRDVAARSQPA